MKAIKNGSGMNIKLNKTQNGGLLGTLLASIGIPLLLKAITGSGKKASGLQNRSPPFYGSWKDYNTIGKRTKKNKKKK